ncbi:hypothetical protein B4U79_01157 [Dinothrombium tinctorium]|uniref:Uncharacterized protein n=1 Tax=Dinothrombium tinctorium TaxID=1965070 RepID=A0A3S3SB31_9ACAR|nr:hypothetical protein B4U79_01157 [Dinothrombium tinctorium]
MLRSEIKNSLSSFEFSLFNENNCNKICPCCGCYLLTEPTTEVRLSSIFILLGVGSFVCYKLIQRKKRKGASFKLFDIINYLIDGFDQPSDSSQTNLQCDFLREQNENVSYELFSDDLFDSSLADETIESRFSRRLSKSQLSRSFSQSSIFGSNTIVKLDQLLNQIEDIKQSVAEMDAELFNVESTSKIKERQYFKITANMSLDEELNEQNSDECSPSLEWDSNDINFSELAEARDVCDNLTQRKQSLKTHRNTSSHSLISLTPSNSSLHSSSSAKDSLLSSPEQETNKVKTLQDLLEEARRLGILSDLIRTLLKDSNRDSAYCED